MEMVFRDGVRVRLVARGSASAGGELALEGRARKLGDLIAKLRGVTAGVKAGGQRGFVVDAAVSLDLTVPENLSATERFLELLVAAPTVEPNEWDDRVRTLADRVKDDGTVDVSLSRVTTTEDETGYSLPFLGAEHVRASRTHELLAAWSAIRGGPLRDREDCVPAGE
jgi:hypothetical protein